MVITKDTIVYDNDNNTYQVLDVIGNGSFGYVYKLIKQSDNSIFALKTLPADFYDQTLYDSFINEGKLALTLNHDNIIKYYYFHDSSVHKELPPYIIMEYAKDGTLKNFIENQKNSGSKFSNDILNSLFLQLINGMEAINAKLIHRDIKPDNILLSDGVLKISDFGLSKVVIDKTRSRTFKGIGHLLYMAPEGWKNDKNSIQMDIYSMGIAFYELSTLTYPYDLKNLNILEDFQNMHLFQQADNPQKRNPSLSFNISQIILRMIDKSTSKRFNTWAEIRDSLNNEKAFSSTNQDLVKEMLGARIEKDIIIQKEQLEKQNKENEKIEKIKLIKYQFDNEIIAKLNEFIEEFNQHYSGQQKMSIVENNRNNKSFSHQIRLVSGNTISIDLRVILEEDFYRTKNIRTPFGETVRRNELSMPKLNNIPIKAWGVIKTNSGEGFNVILTEIENDMYGKWNLMLNYNHLNDLSHRRPEPFPFDFNEIEKEIELIRALHIYKTNVIELDINKFYELLKKYN